MINISTLYDSILIDATIFNFVDKAQLEELRKSIFAILPVACIRRF